MLDAPRSGRDRPLPRGAAAGSPPLPRFLPTVWRGVRRRCPHCGREPLFVRWIALHQQCAACGLVYLRNQGDIWFFWVVMDRIPILLGVATIFFGFRITNWLNGLGFFPGHRRSAHRDDAATPGRGGGPQLPVARLLPGSVRRAAGCGRLPAVCAAGAAEGWSGRGDVRDEEPGKSPWCGGRLIQQRWPPPRQRRATG